MGVINDVLDMSKIEANKLELSYADFEFRKMLGSIIDVIGVRAKEKHQRIAVKVNENIPPIIISDELRLSQVITNLFTNAIKFTPDNGKIELTVEKLEESADIPSADAPSEDGEVTLKIGVADSGIGISPEQQKKLFSSFNQADGSITKRFGGTGLGLAISKRIVEFMQGTIWIESELGKGAKFIFTIKAKKGTQDALKASSAGTKATDFDFKKYTILAAEDMDLNREILGKYLEKTGITVDFAENGKEAVDLFTKAPDRYNLIFMDINMPEMDGYEASQAIRALETPHAKNIHIIAMTADVFKEDIKKCISAGMNDHISKPIVMKDMYLKLEKYLNS
jgi:CheY-like chemotaxis protein